ncbi:MAG: AAA family ATPase [Candidatus Binatus sp.]
MPEDLVQFEDFVLNRGAYELRRGDVVVPLQRIPLELLCLLVERRGQLVTREEILERVWGKGVFVDIENSINTAVRKVRRALSDEPDAPRFVVTVPARGYRFIAELRGPKTTRDEQFHARQPGVMVGRERELTSLLSGLDDAAARRGRLVLISGEPGVGKTRMADEVAAAADVRRMAIMVGHCSEHDEAVAYLPFVEILENFVDRASNADTLRVALGEQASELARLIPKLKNILPELPPPLDLPPAQARRHLFNCFFDFVARIASQRPTLMILEDLHWADDSTLSLLDHLTQRLSDLPLMVIGTYRDAELNVTHELAKTLEDLLRGRLSTRVRLTGLPCEEVGAMLNVLSGKSAPAAVVAEIFAETEGNPFFVEELFRHLEEENRLYDSAGQFRSALEIGELDAPPSVKLVVARRLARLNDLTQKVLATAAVSGRFFSFEILQASNGADADSILEQVEEAEKAGLVFPVAESSKVRFMFSHELIRQAVLSSLSAVRRQRLHLEVAEAIERTCAAGSGSTFAGSLDDHIAELAHHYVQAADARMGAHYLRRAGEQALGRAAYPEAEARLTQGLALLGSVPADESRDREELASQLALGRALHWLRDWRSHEFGGTFRRVLELARKLDSTDAMVEALDSLRLQELNRGQLGKAHELAEEMLQISERTHDPTQCAVGNAALAHLLLFEGDFTRVRECAERGIAASHRVPRVSARLEGTRQLMGMLRSRASWFLGFPEEALRQSDEIIAGLNDWANPFERIRALLYGTDVFVYCGLPGPVRSRLAQVEMQKRGISRRDNPREKVLRGWLAIQEGRFAEGARLIAEGDREEEGPLFRPFHAALIAQGLARAGEFDAAMVALDNVLGLSARSEFVIFNSEVYRAKGEVLLNANHDGAEADAAECFRLAIDIARGQRAKSSELRATTSLARLLDHQGKRDEARTMLAEIYNWFTEGFDTPDLKDAKALLDELNE